MSLLERTVFFRQFWLGCYLRTWSACAFTQFIRYHDRLVQLRGGQ